MVALMTVLQAVFGVVIVSALVGFLVVLVSTVISDGQATNKEGVKE